jgi:hypothetical protein
MRPARLEGATFWFVADKRHLSPPLLILLRHSKIRRYGNIAYPGFSEITPIFQLSASVSASVKPSPSDPREEEL